MGSIANDPSLVVIVGPTASGKSALAVNLAKRFNGEIIAADSRTVYRGMDIGTAKPSMNDRTAVPHHLLDIVNPDDSFTVADFQRLAKRAVVDIAARGRVPFLVGGSGLYIDAVIYDFGLRPAADPAGRAELQKLSVDELQERILDKGIALPFNKRNPRHLIRTLETGGLTPVKGNLRSNTLVIGLDADKEDLEVKIAKRVSAMVDAGFVEEVRRLAARYGWDSPALQAPGYRSFQEYIGGTVSLEEAKRLFVQRDLQYAKRQKTWFKRSSDIHWISNPEEAVDLVTTFLNN
ncbi:MAG TPA: tRNA (adenosine(37)-N6)-dimethylallyltransferase MiaA [Candidatus Pristimantibacillus sp.]|jgi:tRNA dimethylallyltransferase|nr:tRNA (adenosine(37)-N6)-dimethylallyltransferase MiaA [Candidatus Pristimantibacillus sp.]